MIPNSKHPIRRGLVQTAAMCIGIASFVFLASDFPSRFLSVSRSSRGYSIAVRTTDVVNSVVPADPGTLRGNSGVSGQTPVIGSGVFDWQLKFSATGKVFKDVSFASPLDGYLVTELGAVYRTTDGGETWQLKMNLGFPYYWYGVEAVTSDTVIISGFNNQGNINDGVVRWSFDGGSTWSDDIVLSIPSGVGWLDRVHFFGSDTGIVMAAFSGGAHYTTTGGKDTAQWQYVQINPDAAWFAGNIDAQPSGDIYATGIHFAHSSDFGITWTSMPSIDAVFDGGVDFLDETNQLGLTGGGQISAPVQGWVHRTTDGGQSWSPRLTTFPYPIRSVKLLDDSIGLAAGGNVFGESGGIHLSTDGGLTWNLDVQTDAEMFAIEVVPLPDDSVDIWCAGSTGGATGFIGRLYKTRISLSPGATGVSLMSDEQPVDIVLLGNYPNPFNASTTVGFRIGDRGFVTVKVYDLLGQVVETLVAGDLSAGAHTLHWDATGVPSGVYFCRLEVWNSGGGKSVAAAATRKMALLR